MFYQTFRFSSVSYLVLVTLGLYVIFSVEVVAKPTCSSEYIEETDIPGGTVRIEQALSPNSEETAAATTVNVATFCMSVNEVSVGQFMECVSEGACRQVQMDPIPDGFPMHSVRYSDVMDFVAWFQEKTGLPYELPSEAQWQHAALGGLKERYPWRTVGQLPDVNIFSDALSPVGKTSPNEFGIRDMIGNVAEYVADCFSHDPSVLPKDGNPYVAQNCKSQAAKGGHYSGPSFFLSPYFRFQIPHKIGLTQLGFRLSRPIETRGE